MKKIVTALFCITLAAWAVPCLSTTIVASMNQDVYGSGGVGSAAGDAGREYFMVGDQESCCPDVPGRRGILQFSLLSETGLPIAPVGLAILNLTIVQSHRDIPSTTAPPFTNPGLGITRVIHIAQHSPADPAASYGAPSIGNDPGELIPSGLDAGPVVSIDVTKAIQQALEAGKAFVTFRIQTDMESDGDGRDDTWYFASANNPDPATQPVIEVHATKTFWLNHYYLWVNEATTSTDNLGLNISLPTGERPSLFTTDQAPEGRTILGVRVCYATSNTRSFIKEIILNQFGDPPTHVSIVMYKQTDLTDPGPICVNSRSKSIDSSAGPLLLDLVLNFGDMSDTISIRGVGLLLQATE